MSNNLKQSVHERLSSLCHVKEHFQILSFFSLLMISEKLVNVTFVMTFVVFYLVTGQINYSFWDVCAVMVSIQPQDLCLRWVCVFTPLTSLMFTWPAGCPVHVWLPPPYEGVFSRRVAAFQTRTMVRGRGSVAVWRIKLAAVDYRVSPTLPVHLLSPVVLLSGSAPVPSHPAPPCHTQFLNSCTSHDTISSVQPLLPRVLWLSSMQISHVLIVVIYLFLYGGEKKRAGGVSSEVDLMTEQEKKRLLWVELPSGARL